MTDLERSVVTEAGAAAHRDQQTIQMDPFPRGSEESLAWRSGWMGEARK